MKGFRFVQGAAVSLAAMGLMVPPTAFAESTVRTASKTTSPQRASIPNVFLTEGGTLTGGVTDSAGNRLEGAKVSIRQGKTTIATAVTDKNGIYSFKGLKGGTYEIGSGNTEGVFQVWSERTAPPSAKQCALLVMGENGERGQCGCCDPTLILLSAGVIAAVVLSAIILHKVNQIDNKVDKIPHSP